MFPHIYEDEDDRYYSNENEFIEVEKHSKIVADKDKKIDELERCLKARDEMLIAGRKNYDKHIDWVTDNLKIEMNNCKKLQVEILELRYENNFLKKKIYSLENQIEMYVKIADTYYCHVVERYRKGQPAS